MFDSTKKDLKDLLRNAHEGRLQLPDFQRDYVWNDEDVRSLIASVAKGFPVGALLTLETGGEVRFKPRAIEGAPAQKVAPDELLLDGQQRITSLYQSMCMEAPVRCRNAKGIHVERYYYIDIERAVSNGENIEDAIVGVPANKILLKDFGRTTVIDLSSREKEFEHNHFPLNQVFDSHNWFYDWRDFWRERGTDVSEIERDFYRKIVERIQRYEMPIIRLDRSNSREAICLVFEKVNVGGKKLDAFELVTAIFASDGFDIRADWRGDGSFDSGRMARIVGEPERNVLTALAATDFLQACTLLHTREVRLQRASQGAGGRDLPSITCRRDALLALPLSAYQAHADALETGFIEAGNFLNEQKIIWNKDIPYPPLLVALAAVFAISGRPARSVAAKDKISHWFWSVVLGELYGSSAETRLARDVPELVDWIAGGTKPQSIDEALFQKDRLLSLRTRQSAAYKGLHALMMKSGCRDFITDRPTDIMTFFNDDIDIHHVFPQAWCKKQGISSETFNSIVNKTPLSKLSNIEIGGDAPSEYLERIEDKYEVSPDRLNVILRTHLIEPAHLRNDDFEAFFAERFDRLAEVVVDAMKKPVVIDASEDEAALASSSGLEEMEFA